MKVFIFPYNSLILYDLVERCGHKPLASMQELTKRMRQGTTAPPPYHIDFNDLQSSLESCSVDVPSGVRGRQAFLAPLVKEADAAIFITDPEYAFGVSGCARANELVWHQVVEKGIPTLTVRYPRNYEQAEKLVTSVTRFLEQVEGAGAENSS